MLKKLHEPVLLKEVISSLHVENQARYIDATLGTGGYTKAMLEKGAEVLSIDADESMIQIAKRNLKGLKANLVHANFKDISRIATDKNFKDVDGIVFDLGVSNVHFQDDERGFSFRNPDADLDMRLDPKSNNVKASDLLNILREDQLKEIFGKSIAKKIVEFRKKKKFQKVNDFLEIFSKTNRSAQKLAAVKGARSKRVKSIHPATVPFMMLRIAVNSELDNLRKALPQAWDLLKPGGRLVVISFHSLEDEIVKNFFK